MTGSATDAVAVEPAGPDDLARVVELMRALAEAEGNAARFTAGPDRLHAALFGPNAGMACWVARGRQAVVGAALGAVSWTALTCRPTLRLVTLIVDASWRSQGVGRRLLAAVAHRCAELDCGLDFVVRSDNIDAQRFYAALGAERRPEWQPWRLGPDALRDLVTAPGRPDGARPS